jgi:hypothetical protein
LIYLEPSAISHISLVIQPVKFIEDFFLQPFIYMQASSASKTKPADTPTAWQFHNSTGETVMIHLNWQGITGVRP